jgi:hypothetical protein
MIVRKLQTFWQLDPQDRSLFAESLVLSVAIALGFATVGVRRTREALERVPLAGGRREQVSTVLGSAVRLQRIAQRTVGFEGTCLARSMALWAILRRRRIATELRIGVRKVADRIEGHAWLEFDGIPINENSAITATYQVFEGAEQLWLLKALK